MKLTKSSIKQFLIVTALMVGALSLFSFAPGALAAADLVDQGDNIVGTGGDLKSTIIGIVKFFLGFLGLLAVIMIIYAGFLYVTDAGGGENVDKAKKIILYAVIGIVVILLSFAIVNTVFEGATSATNGNSTSVTL